MTGSLAKVTLLGPGGPPCTRSCGGCPCQPVVPGTPTGTPSRETVRALEPSGGLSGCMWPGVQLSPALMFLGGEGTGRGW